MKLIIKCQKLINYGKVILCLFQKHYQSTVNFTKRYISTANLKSSNFLISRLFATKKAHIAEGSYNLSYTSTREMFLKLIDPIADNKNLGLRSLRAGGVSAATESDVSDGNQKKTVMDTSKIQ